MSLDTAPRPDTSAPLRTRVETARAARAAHEAATASRRARAKDLAAYAAAGAIGGSGAALVSWWLVATITLPIPI